MTIKEFSKLCGCNPQTLRYYDHANLLKPSRVDRYTGYRFYEEDQAITYVKIKNLQRAGFTIEEIRELLNKDDIEVFFAFESKIIEGERKIQEIREIQKAYQDEAFNMMNRIEEFQKILKESIETYDPKEEFGISQDAYLSTIELVDSLLNELVEDGDITGFEFSDYAEEGEDAEEVYFEGCLNNPEYTVIFEKHGWKNAKEFLREIPEMNEIDGYLLLFRVDSTKKMKTAFANTIIGICLDRSKCRLNIGCTVIDSKDEQNHFWLMKCCEEN